MINNRFILRIGCIVLMFVLATLLCTRQTFYITEKSAFTAPRENKDELTVDTEGPLSYKTEMVQVNDSTSIETWVITPAEPDNLIFFFPANANHLYKFKSFLSTLAVQANARIVGVHYRGYGKSSGHPAFDASFADHKALFNREISGLNNCQSVSVMGISIGTLFAGALTSTCPEKVDNVILLSAISTPEKMMSESMRILVPFYARPFISIEAEPKLYSLNNVKFLSDFQNNMLVVQAKDDKETGYKMGVELYEKVPAKTKKLYTIKSGGHFAPISEDHKESVISEILKIMHSDL